MKKNWSGIRSIGLRIAAGVLLLIFSSSALAAPRDPLPPWPESTLGIWSFDQGPVPMGPARFAAGADTAPLAESWSGYSLVRDATTMLPVAIPVIDPYLHNTNFTTRIGTVRFWFKADWSSAGLGGKGPGAYARLIELVSLNGKEPETLYALYFNPEGTAIYLSGQGVGGATDFLKTEVRWAAGRWHLITLAYDETQTALFLGRTLVATGPAMPDVPAWKQSALGLAIGSDVAGGNPALGQFDELAAFDHPLTGDDVQWYWRGTRRVVALGPVASEEEELVKQDAFSSRSGMQLMSSELPEFPPEDDDPPAEGDPVPPPEYTSPSYPSNSLWLSIERVSNGVAYLTLHGTVPGEYYEIQSKENLGTNTEWQFEGVWPGTPEQDWTSLLVAVGTRTNKLFMRARSWADSDGDGLPDWWEVANGLDPALPDSGNSGISDGDKDTDGDGWTVLHEYGNGTSIFAFNTPHAPQGLTATLATDGTTATLHWLPAGGNVTNYAVGRLDYLTYEYTFFDAGPTNAFVDADYPLYEYDPNLPIWPAGYTVRADYADGHSDWSANVSPHHDEWSFPLTLTSEKNNSPILLMGGTVPPDVTKLELIRYDHFDGGAASVTNIEIMRSQFEDGKFPLPESLAPHFTNGTSDWAGRFVSSNVSGVAFRVGFSPEYFRNGSVQIRENATLALRAASMGGPLSYAIHDWGTTTYSFPSNYAHSGITAWSGDLSYGDFDAPFHGNYLLRNLVYSTSDVDGFGALTTGYFEENNSVNLFEPLTYQASIGRNQTNFTPQLPVSETRWILPRTNWATLGIQKSGSVFSLPTSIRNWYGLPLDSVLIGFRTNNSLQLVTLSASGSFMDPGVECQFYPEFQQPQLEPQGFYFARLLQDFQMLPDLQPGDPAFEPSTTQPMLFVNAGEPVGIVGFEKQGIANGYTDKFAYLGQYFDKAYKANANGTRSTNQTGILSPYGAFFATEPGKTFLTTKPDGVSTNIGECVVNVIKLQLDVNHDGVMDTSWSGPDNTAWENPFAFWVNNDADDATNGDMKIPTNAPYLEDRFAGKINCARNLEDFARLWIMGLPQFPNTNDYSVTLSIFSGSNAAINLYAASDTNGGTGYLTDTNAAAAQLSVVSGFDYGLKLAKIQNGSDYRLPFNPDGTLKYTRFLFEGFGPGFGELTLTISNGVGRVSRTTAYLRLSDVKDLYERATVTNVIQSWPAMVQTQRVSGIRVVYSPPPSAFESKQVAVFVHGWRMPQWEYENFSETMFKRLYWQGYAGRFCALRWPTRSSDTDGWVDYLTYNRSEQIAFNSGTGTATYFNELRGRYTNSTISVCAHSMGGIVLLETLKQLAAHNETPLNNCVFMQAAVPAHCFDTNISSYSPFMDTEQDYPTPNTYRNYGVGINNALRPGGKINNFYNPADFALFIWENNQAFYATNLFGYGLSMMKPNTFMGYSSDGTNGSLQANDWSRGALAQTFGFYYTNGVPRSITNAQELMPFVSRPRSMAVGAQASVHGEITGQEFNLNTQLGFSTSKSDHSGQFNRNIQGPTWFFYSQLRTNLFPTP